MSKNIVFEGWLTKSPPTKRIWRTKWRRRWFALRQSGELPGQYFLDYYTDRNYRRLKGTINLDLCEQVDAGLQMEHAGNGADTKLRGSVFTIQTQSRKYHLEADCEADMEKWVDAICRVCGLRATDDQTNELGTYQNNVQIHEQYECGDDSSPYIPISECITGVRAQDTQRAFTFDPNNIVVSTRTSFEHAPKTRHHQMYMSQPHIRLNNADFSENESNLSDEECKSLNASQSNIRDWSVAKTFTKLAISPKRNGITNGPPVPPRPPKKSSLSRDLQNEASLGPKLQDTAETHDVFTYSVRAPRRMSHGATMPSNASLLLTPTAVRHAEIEDETSPGHISMQYCNLPSLPPAVDRALKPRNSSHIGNLNSFMRPGHPQNEDSKADVLQYLDLDLHPSKPTPSKPQEVPRTVKKMEVFHGKSLSAVDTDAAYKTVDFLKTEAFNITRQDAEASRSIRQDAESRSNQH